MTLDEIRQGTRIFSKQLNEEAGALLPADNIALDFYINWATEIVVMDLVVYIPDDYLDYEDISLSANDNESLLTKGWIQIWAMLRNVPGEKRKPIPYVRTTEQMYKEYAGETASEPLAFTLKGQTIIWLPTPSADYTDFARCWIVASEVATMVDSGPAYIPRQAHRLIVVYASILLGIANDWATESFEKAYAHMLKKVRDSLGFRVQGQPEFLRPSFFDRQVISSRDPAFFDHTEFFG